MRDDGGYQQQTTTNNININNNNNTRRKKRKGIRKRKRRVVEGHQKEGDERKRGRRRRGEWRSPQKIFVFYWCCVLVSLYVGVYVPGDRERRHGALDVYVACPRPLLISNGSDLGRIVFLLLLHKRLKQGCRYQQRNHVSHYALLLVPSITLCQK